MALSFRNFVLLPLVVLLSQAGFSQQNFTLYGLNAAPQAAYLNPGLKQDHRIYISLPAGLQNFSAIHSGFRLSDVIETRGQDDSLLINPSSVSHKLRKKNIVGFESYNELLGFGIRVGKNYFSFNASARTQARVTYTRDFYELLAYGNGGNMLGKRVELDETAIDGSAYMEYGFGFNRQLTEKLTVGARLKFISGVANVRTKKTALGLHTDPTTYAITIDGTAHINTSNVSQFYADSSSGYNILNDAFTFRNFGVGVDLGATYDLTEKLTITASLLDFGFIRWKQNVTNYKTKDLDFRFNGIDYDNFSFDSIHGAQKLLDSLHEALGETESTSAYTTALYSRFLVGAQWEFTDLLYAGALLYSDFTAGRYSPALSLRGGVKVGSWLNATLSYSMFARSYSNIGLGVVVRGGPVQFFATTDNILGLFDPLNAKYVQASAGLSIVIGKQKDGRDTPNKETTE